MRWFQAGSLLLMLLMSSTGRANNGDPRYPLNFLPSSWHWEIVPLVEDFQSRIPERVRAEIKGLSREELVSGFSVHYSTKVRFAPPDEGSPQRAAVELTQLLIELPYSEFTQKLPPAEWSSRLAHYLGGEREIEEADSLGRPVRQVERMVLSALPFDIAADPFNQDMVKVEEIRYGQASSTVYWRVIYSENGSTEQDIGSVKFEAYDDRSVLVTFHSAHRLRALGIPVPATIARPILSTFFREHLESYRRHVTSAGDSP